MNVNLVKYDKIKNWNSLPLSIRETKPHPTFRRHLKTFYFKSAPPLSAAHLAWNIFVYAPWFF